MTAQESPALVLGRFDPAAKHAFAHPDHVAGDRAVLCMLLEDFHRHLDDVETNRPVVRYVPDPDEWHRRVVIPQPEAFHDQESLTVVGFFGRTRDVIDPLVARRIQELSGRLVEAVMCTPGVLGYSTHLLADEKNYANLVLVSAPGVIERWRTTAPHPSAAADWSPRYYQYVRIYRGSIGAADRDCTTGLQLESVKYWDYRNDPVWRAVRSLR